MNGYFGYTRVSTVKQGERGTSLDEQKGAIEAYALRHGLKILAWYEEMHTAAKQGRPQFTRLLADVRKGRAQGVVIHKIDRSARNLKDWALLGDLIDAGVDVRFAHESIDLASRGGRLSADIQAVVAADFIRNHRQVVRMGFEGRLKQGLYPLPAPRGYLNCGKARRKEIDPVSGPLVRQAFELYASGGHTFHTLRLEMAKRGLHGPRNRPLSLNALSVMLRNSFYYGVIRVKKTGQTFEGTHEPLVTSATFKRAQAIMAGRVFAKPQRHDHTYRRIIRCERCGYALTAEIQKGHTYYRCHQRGCPGVSVREEEVDQAVRDCLERFKFSDEEFDDVKRVARERLTQGSDARELRLAALKRDLAACDDRLSRLTDALVDGLVDKASFEFRKGELIAERRRLHESMAQPSDDAREERALEVLDLHRTASLGFTAATPEEKRAIVRELTESVSVHEKEILLEVRPEFEAFLNACDR